MSEKSKQIPLLVIFYAKYLDSQDTAAFISNVSRFYTIGTLERMTRSDRPETRRSAALALGFLGDYEVNRTFGRLLHDEDKAVRTLAENGIRSIWTRMGNDQDRQTLRTIMRLISARHYDEAIVKSTELLETTPRFAEALNQRAVAHFALKQYEHSVEDGLKTIELNPYHFGAAIGVGQSYLYLGNLPGTMEYFQLALQLNPNLENVKTHLRNLVHKLKGD
ncbi:MAG: hypothetical protein LBQ54_08655 [Planctomycetaceae bacterium]|nr:hypothetical protein [Planctomycetaceae bacterium]